MNCFLQLKNLFFKISDRSPRLCFGCMPSRIPSNAVRRVVPSVDINIRPDLPQCWKLGPDRHPVQDHLHPVLQQQQIWHPFQQPRSLRPRDSPGLRRPSTSSTRLRSTRLRSIRLRSTSSVCLCCTSPSSSLLRCASTSHRCCPSCRSRSQSPRSCLLSSCRRLPHDLLQPHWNLLLLLNFEMNCFFFLM